MELILKGDEIGYISNHDDQSFGMFCPTSADEVFAELSKLRAENEALRVVLSDIAKTSSSTRIRRIANEAAKGKS